MYHNTNTFIEIISNCLVGLERVSEVSDISAAYPRSQWVKDMIKQRQEHQKKLIVSGSSLLGSSAE